MKRRDFMKGTAVAVAAQATQPFTSQAASFPGADGAASRSEDGVYVERFSSDSRVRSGMALGGIGAGFFEIRKDGRFYNWSIFNNFPKETGPEFVLPVGEYEDPMAANLFFKVRYEVAGQAPRMKLLQLTDGLNEGGEMGVAYRFPWMEAIDQIEYSARFPFARLRFTDAEMPFEILMDAWSPFIPHDVKNSALPVAFFDFKLVSKIEKPVDVMIMMTARNNAGYEDDERFYTTEIKHSAEAKTVVLSCGGIDEKLSTCGQIAITSMAGDSTHYTGWSVLHPYYEYVLRHKTLPNLDDTNGTASIGGQVPSWMPPTNGRNSLDPKTGKKRGQTGGSNPGVFSTLARSFQLNRKGAEAQHTFVYSWNFPNLYAEAEFRKRSNRIEGHYYSNFFANAADVADYAVQNRTDLLKRSRRFLDDFFSSSADVYVLEQVNSQLNTFATSGRLVKSGDFGVLEGLAAGWSWGPTATMDVMLYGTTPIIALFPELQKATMRCHARVQTSKGEVSHGLEKSFQHGEDGTAGVSHRLDLPGQFVIMVLRDYFWTNDKKYLRDLYPAVQRAIDYIVNNRAFAGDGVPIMRGIECSYDNFPMHGYASYIVSQWLCALASAVEAADAMGDTASKSRYTQLLDKARARMEDKLWNGRFYRLYNDTDKIGGKGDVSDGCLTDQLVGQWAAHQSLLGHLVTKDNIDTALRSILDESYRPGFGLRNCSWPGAKEWSDVDRDTWVDQGNTCWSGVELAFAGFLLYEGFHREALEIVRTVDRRYRKNGLYWDHQEFGGHYFRPMSGWSIINGMLGLGVNQGRLRFDPQMKSQSFKLFFALPSGTGHFIKSGQQVAVRCLTGILEAEQVEIRGEFKGQVRGNDANAVVTKSEDGFTTWKFPRKLSLRAGEEVAFG